MEYRAATRMAHADALSRNPPIDADTKMQSTSQCPTVLTISDDDWLLTLQLGDIELSRIHDILSSKLDIKRFEYINETWYINK